MLCQNNNFPNSAVVQSPPAGGASVPVLAAIPSRLPANPPALSAIYAGRGAFEESDKFVVFVLLYSYIYCHDFVV